MATIVELPNGTEAEFPDGMDHAAISTAIQSHLAKQPAVATASMPNQNGIPFGMSDAIKRSTEQAQSQNIKDLPGQIGRRMISPVVSIPRMQGSGVGAQIVNELSGFAEGLESPAGLGVAATLGPISEATPLVGNLIKGGFGALGLHQAYGNIKDKKPFAAAVDIAGSALAFLDALAPDKVTPEQRVAARADIQKFLAEHKANQDTSNLTGPDIQDFETAQKAKDAGLPQTAEELTKPNPIHENQASQPEAPRPEPDERSPGNREAGAEVQPTKAALTPALQAGSQIIPSLPGESHVDIANRINSELPNPSPQRDQINEAVADDSRHVFVDQTGNVLDRDQGGKFADENRLRSPDAAGQPLHSEHLNAQAQALPEAAKEGTAPVTPGATPEQLPESAGREGGTDGGKDEAPSVSIENTKVKVRREAEGNLDILKQSPKTNPVSLDEATQRIKDDPGYGTRIINQLRDGSKTSVDVVEEAALLREAKTIRDARDAAAMRASDPSLSEQDKAISHNEWQQNENRLNELDQATRAAGTSAGQVLQFRKRQIADDYSLVGIENKARAIKGRALTSQESDKIKTQATEIDRVTKAADEREAVHQKEQGNKALDTSIGDMLKEAKPENPRVASLAERLVRGLESEADKARDRIRERLGQTNAGVDPTVLYDLSVIGASHIARGSLEFGRWSGEFLKDLGDSIGEKVKPHLQEIFDASNKHLDERVSGTIPEKERAAVKIRATKQEGAGEREQLISKIEAKTKDGTLKDAQPLIQKLALNFVRSGITEREPLLDAVHEVVSRLVPDATRSETRDAISGYGDYRQLDQETAKVQLRQLKGEMQQIGKIEDMQSGEAPKRTGVERRTPSDQERALIREVNKLKDVGGFNITDPATQLKSRLQAYKTRTANRITDLQERLDAGDFAKRVRPELEMDPEANRLRVEAQRLKKQIDIGFEKERLSNRPKWQKALEQVSGAARASALSGYHTLLKLASYDATKIGLQTPAEELTGAALSKIPGLSPIFEKANLESGNTIRALGDFYTNIATKGMKAAWQVLKTGSTDSKVLYGKPETAVPHWYDFIGNLHYAEKAPLFTGTESMYIRRGIESAARSGLDVSDEFVRAKINKDAFDYAQKSILQENNVFADAVNGLQARMEAVNPRTRKVDVTKAVISTLIKTLLTKGIVKTPANYFSQVIKGSPIGLLSGLGKAVVAHISGIDTLHPVEANSISGLLKAGAVGTAFFALGAIDGTRKKEDRIFGGYWEPGRKRDDGDVPWGQMRIDGKVFPHIITHNVLTEEAQMGSTMMRVALSKFHGGDEKTKGMTEGAIKAVIGLAGKAPIASPIMRMGQDNSNTTAEILNGLVPQLIQNIAEDTDRAPRNPKSTSDFVKMGIPGLRESVPEKSPSKTSSRQRLKSRRIKR